MRKYLLGVMSWIVCFVALGQAPSNDNFVNATTLYGSSATFSGTLSNATLEAGESSCVCYICADRSVWWNWTATNSTAVVIDILQHTSVGTSSLAIHTGPDVFSLTDVTCGLIDSISNRHVSFAATAGTTYHIRVRGDAADSFTLRLTAGNSPVILGAPESQTIPESDSVMFGVFAAGLPPLKYQWCFEGNNLPGETAPALVLHYLAASRAGGYSVVVSNASGVITSAVATLTISPTNPPLVLTPINSPEKDWFYFSIAGQTGRLYRVESTTNLTNWEKEDSFYPPYFYDSSVVQNSNATSIYYISTAPHQKWLRVSHYKNAEMCIAQLKAIQFAIKLWAIENSKDTYAPVDWIDISPYLKGPVVCPSGGITFDDSYQVSAVRFVPTCKKVPAVHMLPP